MFIDNLIEQTVDDIALKVDDVLKLTSSELFALRVILQIELTSYTAKLCFPKPPTTPPTAAPLESPCLTQ